MLNHINVWGGCCGTNHPHIEAIAKRFGVKKKAP
ncbi:MAG: homocysteine S-methyltransferase family protein [Crocosphaera sp.]|nr:homocysteine S-methyltransferase family protein [Crocosphaera sp.]